MAVATLKEKTRHWTTSQAVRFARNAILARVSDGDWSGNKSIVSLRQLLIDSGRDDVPSADTLARRVDELHDEIGDAALHRCGRRTRSK